MAAVNITATKHLRQGSNRGDQQGAAPVPPASTAFDSLRSFFSRETLTMAGQRKRDRTLRLTVLGLWLTLVLADSSTMLVFHLSCFAALTGLLWMVYSYCFLRVLGPLRRSRWVQLQNPPPVGTTTSSSAQFTANLSMTVDDDAAPGQRVTTSEQLEQFTAHFGLCIVFCSLRLLVLPETGSGEGSVVAGILSLLVVISVLRLGWTTLNPDIRAVLAVKESWMAILAVCWWIFAMIMIHLREMPFNIVTQTVLSAGMLYWAISKTSLKITFFPLVWLAASAVVTVVAGGFLLWLMLAATNPSWALVQNNTKLDLLAHMGTSRDFILDAKEVCTREDAMRIPKEEFPLIFKPNMCTTSNHGVRPVFNHSDAVAYIENSPMPGKKLHRGGCYTLAQRFVRSKKEFVVYYIRYPYFSEGFIKTVGVRSKARQVEAGKAETTIYNQGFFGGYFFSAVRDDLATPKLLKFVTGLSNAFPGGFHQGRIDMKVEKDEDIANAENLGILEINLNLIADIAEKVNHGNVDDSSIRRLNEGVLGQLMPLRMLRTFGMMMYIGSVNLLMGKITPTVFIKGLPFLIGRAELCQKNYLEHLMGRE